MKSIIKYLSFLLAIVLCVQFAPALSLIVSAQENIGFVQYEEDVEEESLLFNEIDPDDDFEDNKIMVTFKKEYSDPKIEVTKESFPELDIKKITNYTISDPDDNFTRDISITLNSHDKEKVISICEELSQREDVLRACPSYIFKCETCLVPNDPQYYYHSSPYTYINAPLTWDTTTGSSTVKVAVLDTKVDIHDDFGTNLVVGYDVYNQNTVTNDCIDDHGTSVASIIGAKGNNNKNSTGTCWNVSIVPIQFYSSYNGGFSYSNTDIASAFSYMKQNGISIANCSWGGYNWPSGKTSYFKNIIEDWGGILIASAGNDNKNVDIDPHYPSGIDSDNIISVAAANSNCSGIATPADWNNDVKGSNYGASSVDIVAPGTSIYILKENNSATIDNGTSLAAPFVAGAAALLKSAYPSATSKEIIQALEYGSTEYSWTQNKVKYGFLNISNSLSTLQKIINSRKTIEDGCYIFGASGNTFQVVDIANGSINNNASSIMYEANGSSSQKYIVEYNTVNSGNNYYTIKNKNSEKYLEAAGNGTTSGSAVRQNNWTGAEYQKWLFKENADGTYKIINKASVLALDVGSANPSNNQAVTVKTSSSGSSQKIRVCHSAKSGPINDGVYRITALNSNNYGIAYSGNNVIIDYTEEIRIINADGYSYLGFLFGNKALELIPPSSGTAYDVHAVTEDFTCSAQKWRILQSGTGDYYIKSKDSGKVVEISSGSAVSGANIAAGAPTGEANQRFVITEIDRGNAFSSGSIYHIGGISYLKTQDGTSTIDLNTGEVYNINEELIPDCCLLINKELYGLYSIKNIFTGQCLQSNDDNSVSFADYDGSERQLWEISYFQGEIFFLNVHTYRFLVYSISGNNQIVFSTQDDYDGTYYYSPQIYNQQVLEDNGEYYIIPKNEPDKAITISADQYNNLVIVGEDIDINNTAQRFTFSFFDTWKGIYKATPISNNSSYLCFGTNKAELSSSGTNQLSVVKTLDGYYKIMYANKTSFAYENNELLVKEDNPDNDDAQKFMIVPCSDTINNGLYKMLPSGDTTKAVSVSATSDELIISNSDISDVSQWFYIYKDGVSYRIINIKTGKAITCDSSFDSVFVENIDPASISQKWQIVNSSAIGNDYTASIVSFRTGDYLWDNSSDVSSSFYINDSSETFILKKISSNDSNIIGEVVSYSDTTKDLSENNSIPFLSSIVANGRYTVRFEPDNEGLWSIAERVNDNVLSVDNNGSLTFSTNSALTSQKWIIVGNNDGTKSIVNLSTGKVLSNNSGTLVLANQSNSNSNKFIIYIKGDIDLDGEITSNDVLLARRYVSGLEDLTDEQLYCGDLNEDDDVTSADILLIRRIIAGLLEPMSSPNSLLRTGGAQIAQLNSNIMTMSDEEFLQYLFGDVDFDTLRIKTFN